MAWSAVSIQHGVQAPRCKITVNFVLLVLCVSSSECVLITVNRMLLLCCKTHNIWRFLSSSHAKHCTDGSRPAKHGQRMRTCARGAVSVLTRNLGMCAESQLLNQTRLAQEMDVVSCAVNSVDATLSERNRP